MKLQAVGRFIGQINHNFYFLQFIVLKNEQ